MRGKGLQSLHTCMKGYMHHAMCTACVFSTVVNKEHDNQHYIIVYVMYVYVHVHGTCSSIM